YRLPELLGFYYDQGRDALVIADFIEKGKPMLIGPTTGVEGIFLGPAFYYLLAPFYFLGNGNPVFPAVGMAILNILGGLGIYLLGKKFFNKTTGLLAAIIFSFSYQLVMTSRWLANPTPLIFLSVLFIAGLFQIVRKDYRHLLTVSLAVSLGLQCEAASAVFYFPTLAIFLVWQRHIFRKGNFFFFLLAVLIFIFSLLPQIIFNFRHENLLAKAFYNFLVTKQSFKTDFFAVFSARLEMYLGVFGGILFPEKKPLQIIGAIIAGLFLLRTLRDGSPESLYQRSETPYRKPQRAIHPHPDNAGLSGTGVKERQIFRSPYFKTLALVLIVPIVGLFFYQGNNGYVWGYYLTGVYAVFVLFLAGVLVGKKPGMLRKIFLVGFLLVFFYNNRIFLNQYLVKTDVNKKNFIALESQKQALNFIYKDAEKENFNVDVYVPPVIPYAYDYLFRWYGKIYGRSPQEKRVPLLYTLYEIDPPHPERLKAWLARQEGIGKIIYEKPFGGIVVQRRERYPN
ncbi:MAG: glycosyltransferase family 39 protein, partial [bacterium]|nr:glycosyltransferase family 39 protein [bacterium]